jgi:hypothetical protein
MRHSEESAWQPVELVAGVDRLRTLGAKVTFRDGAVREVDLTNSAIADNDLEILSNWTRTGDAGLKELQGLANLGVRYFCDTNVGDAGSIFTTLELA